MATAPKKKSRIKARMSEPSTWGGIAAIAGIALPGLYTYLQTGSKTAGIAAILAALAGGGAIALPENGNKDDASK